MLFEFWMGKGGVGKTTCASASALAHADAGQKTLLISTDPAHSLGDIWQTRIGDQVRNIGPNLSAIEIDPELALERWLGGDRRKVLQAILARGTYLTDSEVERFLELAIPGANELVALREVRRLAREHVVERVVVDTAPTGHTLRMLAVPRVLREMVKALEHMQEKHRVIADALRAGGYQSDAADTLLEELEVEASTSSALLKDAARCQVHWVSLPQPFSILESQDAFAWFEREGIAVHELVWNRVTPNFGAGVRCLPCRTARRNEQNAIASFSSDVPRRQLNAQPRAPRGAAALRALFRGRHEARANAGVRARSISPAKPARRVHVRPDRVDLILVVGKGGVGKTTCAAAIALAIAEAVPDEKILVLSTDPAHSLGDALGLELSDSPREVPLRTGRLWARELDAPARLERMREEYRESIDRLFDGLRGSSRMDATHDRAIVRELFSLAPPGLDELLGLLAIVDALETSPPAFDRLVIDTAPWGHTRELLRLPSVARDWVRSMLALLLDTQVVTRVETLARELLETSKRLTRFIERLRDRERCVAIPITRAEPIPRLECERMLEALESELHIAVPSVVVNGLERDHDPRCPLGATRVDEEERELTHLRGAADSETALVLSPRVFEPPRGESDLRDLWNSWRDERCRG